MLIPEFLHKPFQTALGLLLTSLPVYITPLRFPRACLAPIWFLIGDLLFITDGTVGTHLRMAAASLGALSGGTLLGGFVVSITKGVCSASEHAAVEDAGGVDIVTSGFGPWGRSSCEVGVLCALAALVAMPLAACRPVYAPGTLWIQSLAGCITMGVTVVSAQGLPGVRAVWSQVVGWLLLTAVIGCSALALVTLLPVPDLASYKVADLAVQVLNTAAESLEAALPQLLDERQWGGQLGGQEEDGEEDTTQVTTEGSSQWQGLQQIPIKQNGNNTSLVVTALSPSEEAAPATQRPATSQAVVYSSPPEHHKAGPELFRSLQPQTASAFAAAAFAAAAAAAAGAAHLDVPASPPAALGHRVTGLGQGEMSGDSHLHTSVPASPVAAQAFSTAAQRSHRVAGLALSRSGTALATMVPAMVPGGTLQIASSTGGTIPGQGGTALALMEGVVPGGTGVGLDISRTSTLLVQHQELGDGEWVEMLLVSTKPRTARPRPVFSLAPAATLPKGLLPEWTALSLRPLVASAKKMLASAEAEPRFLSWFLQLGTACTLCLPAGGATGATGDCSDCTTSHQVPPSARQSQSQARAQSGRLRLHRGDVAQWKLVLDTLGTVVDELAALEAVADDMRRMQLGGNEKSHKDSHTPQTPHTPLHGRHTKGQQGSSGHQLQEGHDVSSTSVNRAANNSSLSSHGASSSTRQRHQHLPSWLQNLPALSGIWSNSSSQAQHSNSGQQGGKLATPERSGHQQVHHHSQQHASMSRPSGRGLPLKRSPSERAAHESMLSPEMRASLRACLVACVGELRALSEVVRHDPHRPHTKSNSAASGKVKDAKDSKGGRCSAALRAPADFKALSRDLEDIMVNNLRAYWIAVVRHGQIEYAQRHAHDHHHHHHHEHHHNGGNSQGQHSEVDADGYHNHTTHHHHSPFVLRQGTQLRACWFVAVAVLQLMQLLETLRDQVTATQAASQSGTHHTSVPTSNPPPRGQEGGGDFKGQPAAVESSVKNIDVSVPGNQNPCQHEQQHQNPEHYYAIVIATSDTLDESSTPAASRGHEPHAFEPTATQEAPGAAYQACDRATASRPSAQANAAASKCGTAEATAATDVGTGAAKAAPVCIGPLLRLVLCLDMVEHMIKVTKEGAKAVCGGGKATKEMLRSRVVQAGAKYWLCVACVLVTCICVQGLAKPGLLLSPPIFTVIATSAIMSDKVETTMSKAALRVIGTGTGSVLGWLLMLNTRSAANPFAIAIVVCATGALCAPLYTSQFKLATMLTLASLHAVALCQYVGCCGATGSDRYFVERLVTVLLGIAPPVLVAQLILPWYLSDAARERLAASFSAAAQLLRAGYQELHEQLEDVDHPKGGEGGSKEDNKCSSPSPSKEDKSGVSPSKESNKSSSSPSKTVTAADKPGASPSKTVTAAVDRNAATPASTTSVLLPAAAAPMLGPLTELQDVINREAALWQRGALSIPRVVHELLAALLLLADRVIALQVALRASCAMRPSFSTWSHHNLHQPLHSDLLGVMDALLPVVATTHEALVHSKRSPKHKAAMKRLPAELATLVSRRYAAHAHHARLRAHLHARVIKVAHHLPPAAAMGSSLSQQQVHGHMDHPPATVDATDRVQPGQEASTSGAARGVGLHPDITGSCTQAPGTATAGTAQSLSPPPSPQSVGSPTSAAGAGVIASEALGPGMVVVVMEGVAGDPPASGATHAAGGSSSDSNSSGAASPTQAGREVYNVAGGGRARARADVSGGGGAAGIDNQGRPTGDTVIDMEFRGRGREASGGGNADVDSDAQIVQGVADQFSPAAVGGDTIAWFASLHALSNAMDTVIQVVRTVLKEEVDDAESLLTWVRR